MTSIPILFLALVVGLLLWAVKRSRAQAGLRLERAAFIRTYHFPADLKYKLDQAYPQLSGDQINQVLEGLRAWFLLIAANPGSHLGMPSKAVDAAWHEFIVLTKNYADFCDKAFGKFLHHAPHAGSAKAEQDGLAWTWGSRASLGAGALAVGLGAGALLSSKDLFALDQQLGIAGGNLYSDNDFEQLEKRHSQLAASSSSGSGDGGSSGGATSNCGDGGSCGDGGGGGGGCGGGCGS